jgi:hypothetical protein
MLGTELISFETGIQLAHKVKMLTAFSSVRFTYCDTSLGTAQVNSDYPSPNFAPGTMFSWALLV